jgi:MFS family permease
MNDESVAIPSAPRESALAPLRHLVFRRVWFASTLSNVGGLIQSVGAAWMMLSIAQSADMVALVQTSVALPIMLLSLVAGATADSFDRRKLMLAAQIFMLTVSVALMICTWSGLITPWLLLTFTFLIGCGLALNSPAWQASVGDMVPRSDLPSAVALNSMGFNIARSVGPAIGGAVVAAVGAAVAFAINTVCYLPLIVVLARWRRPATQNALPRETLGIAIGAGLRYVAMSPRILRVLIRAVVFCIGAGAVMALLPLIAKVLVRGGPLTYGFLLGAFGAGAVTGAIANARIRTALSTESIVRWASLAFASAASIAAFSTSLVATMAMLFITGAGWLLTLSTFNVAVQMSAPRWVVARALSIYQMSAFGGLAAGSWLWGAVAESASIPTALLLSAAVLVVCAGLGRWLPLAQSGELNLEPLRSWREPSTAVPIVARSGPIVITVEYLIREADIPEFLRQMNERRRIRRRDGARNWRLLRDLGDPQLWIERYETPTWLDYIRHNSRMTQHDAIVPQRLRELHCGAEGPRVRRLIERETVAPPLEAETRERGETLIDPTRYS